MLQRVHDRVPGFAGRLSTARNAVSLPFHLPQYRPRGVAILLLRAHVHGLSVRAVVVAVPDGSILLAIETITHGIPLAAAPLRWLRLLLLWLHPQCVHQLVVASGVPQRCQDAIPALI